MSALERVAHVVAKDLRRFGWVLLGLLLVLGLHVFGLVPGADDFGRFGYRLPLGFVPLLLSLLTAVVIHEDNPSSPEAFLATRPIGREAMAAAKLTFIGLFLCAVPVALEAVWFRWLDPSAPVLTMAADSALYLASLLVLTAAGAAVTRSLPGLLVLVLGIWIGTTLVDALLATAGVRGSVSIWSGEQARQAAVLLVGTALVAHQFVTRHRRRTAALGGLALLGIPLLTHPTPSAELRAGISETARPIHAADLSGPAASLELRLDRLHRPALAMPLFVDPPFPESSVDASYVARLADGHSGTLAAIESRVEGHDVDASFSFRGPRGHRSTRRNIAPVIPGLSRAGRSERTASPMGTLPIAAGTSREMDALRGAERLEVTVTMEISDWHEIGRLSPTAGARLDLGGLGILAVRTSRRSSTDLATTVGLRWQPFSPSLGTSSGHRRVTVPSTLEEELAFVLHSRRYGEFITDTGTEALPGRRILIGAAQLVEPRALLHFEGRLAGGRGGPPLPDDWFEDVELIVLGRRPVGHISRTFAWGLDGWPESGSTVPVEAWGEPTEADRR